MTNTVTLRAGQPASARLRRGGNSPGRILVVDDEDDIRCLSVAMLIHADLGMVTRNGRERAARLAVVNNRFQERTGLFLLCAVVAHHGSLTTGPYEGLGVHRPFL